MGAGQISYLRDVPEGTMLEDPECVVMTEATFLAVSDYTRSSPTGASVDRIWRRSMQWTSSLFPNWFVFVVWADAEGEKWTTGRPVLLSDGEINAIPSGWARPARDKVRI